MAVCDKPDIGVIVVNYDSAQATGRLLADLAQQGRSGCSLTVVVADNGPPESGFASLRDAYRDDPWVRFETMPSNLGYFGAAHLVLNSVWKNRLPDWLVVSNADIRLPQHSFLTRLADHSAGRCAVIAPKIVSTETGLDQNPFHRHRPSAVRINLNRLIPRVPLLFWLVTAQYLIKRSIRRRIPGNHAQSTKNSTNIYAPHGAFIVFSKEYFRRGGSLNCGAFLFAEEIFVAETCRRLGLHITHSPDLEVLHDEHVSTRGNPAIRRYQAEAADYCFREFFA